MFFLLCRTDLLHVGLPIYLVRPNLGGFLLKYRGGCEIMVTLVKEIQVSYTTLNTKTYNLVSLVAG